MPERLEGYTANETRASRMIKIVQINEKRTRKMENYLQVNEKRPRWMDNDTD